MADLEQGTPADRWHAKACGDLLVVINKDEALREPRPKARYVPPQGGRMEPVVDHGQDGRNIPYMEALRLQTLATRVGGGLFAAYALLHGEWIEALVMAAVASPLTTILIYRILKRVR